MEENRMKHVNSPDHYLARICFADGRVEHFRDQAFAYALWLALRKGTRAAFRGAKDSRPVHPWDYVDAL